MYLFRIHVYHIALRCNLVYRFSTFTANPCLKTQSNLIFSISSNAEIPTCSTRLVKPSMTTRPYFTPKLMIWTHHFRSEHNFSISFWYSVTISYHRPALSKRHVVEDVDWTNSRTNRVFVGPIDRKIAAKQISQPNHCYYWGVGNPVEQYKQFDHLWHLAGSINDFTLLRLPLIGSPLPAAIWYKIGFLCNRKCQLKSRQLLVMGSWSMPPKLILETKCWEVKAEQEVVIFKCAAGNR